MKNICAVIGLCLLSYFASAQTQIAVKGGYDLGTARVYLGNYQPSVQAVSGFGFGILFNAPFDGNLHFTPSIGFNQRGYAYGPYNDSLGVAKDKVNMSYIDAAFTLSYEFPYKSNKFILSLGPVFSYALYGTETTTLNGVSSTGKMDFTLFQNYCSVDISVTAKAAYQVKKMFVEAGFQLGVANIDENANTDGRNIQNRMLSLSVGYYLK